ncbi:glycosyltransferase family 4 protein [Blastococcus xanthinilyticus]|uniref:Glycosyltransferase involved in cell wall biosynthesis n=1 Tax=Blastococcus xanthinilyticus TaxID=1564164 RepID=A0A5S5CRF4_9ACTN|nr:glycosyltransferase family 4 protein [Blastococcus xanthinilyticus]TYP86320.1 glycosyltransferase involved in cell wall biosynthesis [Blastococcus xanthinilyticus]
MPRPQDHVPGVLAQNRGHYELLVAMVRHYAERGDVEHVLRAAMLAANYAWWAPTGLLSDLRLERTVVSAVRGSGSVTVDGDRRGGRVLHVLSEAYSIGGHTRLAWRWMERDERIGDVVLTNQDGAVPERLAESVRASGGELFDLRAEFPGLLDRARALRAHMDRADVVVLHVHPYDAIALAAANLPGVRPPVVYENHADLSFWLGVGAADVLCDLRPVVRTLDVDLRRVPGDRIAVLPMPVEEMPAADDGELRARLGIRPDAVVALTVSDDWKVASASGRAMHDVVDKLLHFSPRLTYVLVGVTPNAHWTRLGKRYPGRLFVVGKVLDVAPYLSLADIYLESYPSFAGTSPLEAALCGLPVVGLADVPADEPAHVFQRWSPGLAERSAATSAGRLAVTVHRLAADPELRQRDGAEARASVRALHDNPGWRGALEALYERARSVPAVDLDDLGESATDDRYRTLFTTFNAAPATVDPRGTVRPLGELYDSTLEADLTAAMFRGTPSPVQVRVAARWEDHPAWTARLLALAGTWPRLRVSLPFVADDDVSGTATVARLTDLLASVGRTTEDCGDVALEHTPSPAVSALPGELVFSSEALDRLEELVASALWQDTPAAAAHARVPEPVAG